MADTYNSIDVRCAAYVLNNAWWVELLVIRFRRETIEDLQKIHTRLWDEVGIIDNDIFRISYHALPIKNWGEISKNWDMNFIDLTSDYAVNIPPNGILNTEMSEPLRNHRDYANEEWDVYDSSMICGQIDMRQILKNQETNARKQGFETIYKYLAAFFEISEDSIYNNEKNLIVITAPVFFKINKVVFEDKKATILCKGDAAKKLSLILDFYNLHPNNTPKKMVKRELVYNIPLSSTELVDFPIDKKFEEDHIDHYFKLVAYKDELIIAKTEASVRSSFPASATNPFSNVLKQFVSFDELKKMIFNFDSKAGNHKGSNFERGIVYLMNILGIKAALLGKGYDTIGEESNKISIDILGTYDNETIILGFATIGMPSDTEFARYRMYIGNLRKLDSNKGLNMYPMLFCGLPTSTLHDKAQENGIRLIGREELETILGLIDEGNVDNARGYLISESGKPQWY
ncbi:MAG TPA: hypothetical protein VFJ23_03960 [Candidatus Nitrosotalea sp.]|nr:hypothetical protein [Candidatus Nitrosotalea sp.]